MKVFNPVVIQDCGLSATELLISSLARAVGTELGEKRSVSGACGFGMIYCYHWNME